MSTSRQKKEADVLYTADLLTLVLPDTLTLGSLLQAAACAAMQLVLASHAGSLADVSF